MRQILLNMGGAVVARMPRPVVAPGTVLIRVRYSFVSIGTEIAPLRPAKIAAPDTTSTEIALERARLLRHYFRASVRDPRKAVARLSRMARQRLAKSGRQPAVQNAAAGRSEPSDLYAQGWAVGYSAAGEVVAVGPGVTEFAAGDRVAAAGAGQANHADYIVVPRHLVCRVPHGCDLRDAASTTIGAIAMQGVRRAAPQLGERVVRARTWPDWADHRSASEGGRKSGDRPGSGSRACGARPRARSRRRRQRQRGVRPAGARSHTGPGCGPHADDGRDEIRRGHQSRHGGDAGEGNGRDRRRRRAGRRSRAVLPEGNRSADEHVCTVQAGTTRRTKSKGTTTRTRTCDGRSTATCSRTSSWWRRAPCVSRRSSIVPSRSTTRPPCTRHWRRAKDGCRWEWSSSTRMWRRRTSRCRRE